MENGFIGGSENLYKYLVTIGLLLVVGTVYYPLKEKQSLELLNITLEIEVRSLSEKISENEKNIYRLKKDDMSFENDLKEGERVNHENKLLQIRTEKKLDEIVNRKKYILFYNIICVIFLPTGIGLCIYGFKKWRKAKECDDQIQILELKKLKLEVEKLESERNNKKGQ